MRTRNAEIRLIAVADAVYKHHGGLTPAALVGMRRIVIEWWAILRRTAFGLPTTAGGLTPAALVGDFRRTAFAYVHRKNRFFVGGHSHGQQTAGGCKPPALAFDANAKRVEIRGHCNCSTRSVYKRPRRADARRSCGHAYVHRKNRFFVGGHSHGNRRAGGVSPPWSAFDTNAKRGNSSHCNCRRSLQTPRRADARRSCGHAYVHRKNRFFVGGHSHGNRRAGGVSPPWGAFDANAKRGNSSHCNCRRRLTNTRRADARRSCSSVASSSNGGRFSPHRVRFTDHGGLTPAALGCSAVLLSRLTAC
jgi:hypothetical protein